MAIRVASVNSISEAFLKRPGQFQACPYCAASEMPKKAVKVQVSSAGGAIGQKPSINQSPWLEVHLKRCRRIKASKVAGELIRINKNRFGLHEECGGCMILDVSEGLCLVENDSGRYVVAANDLTIGQVAQLLQIIDTRALIHDELQELISHLMVKAKAVHKQTAYRVGMRIEFRNGDKHAVARIRRRHGLFCYVVEVETCGGSAYRLTISYKDITKIID